MFPESSGGAQNVPSSNMLSQGPGAGLRFPGPQNTNVSITQNVKDLEDFLSGKIKDTMTQRPMYKQPSPHGKYQTYF